MKGGVSATPNSKPSNVNLSQQQPEVKPKFSMRDEVEQTTKLVAVHNKSVSGLKRMLQRGAVPFPSIAVKKAGTPP